MRLSRVRAIIAHDAGDLLGVSRGPVRKVKGDEHLESELICRLVGIGQLLRRIGIDTWRRAVQSEPINADFLRLRDVELPVGDREVLHNANLDVY